MNMLLQDSERSVVIRMPHVWNILLQSLCVLGLLFSLSCGGELSVSLPGCEDCADRCLRDGNGKGRCVDCLRDGQCQSDSSPTRKCLSNKCVCGTDKDCPQNKYCDGSTSCAECLKDEHCPDNKFPVCLEKKCVQCRPGAISSCSPEGVEVCVKGQQKCAGAGFWGPCEDFLVCKPGERCVQSKCYEACPEPSPCKEGEQLCTTPADVLSGRYKVCQKNADQCWEWSKDERYCGGKEVCDKSQCNPFSCSSPECQLGETRCVDSSSFSVCGRDKNGCVIWLPKEPCTQGLTCRPALGKCSFCEPKAKRECYVGDEKTKGVGECKAGEQFCKEDGAEYSTCQNMVLPQREICNDKDDNCNGQIDEDFPTKGDDCEVGEGECKAKGKLVCKSNGFGVECDVSAGATKTEECNGKDDDCDGKIDNKPGQTDPIEQSCYTGEVATRNVGLCKSGTQICVKGAWESCKNQVLPQKELCDNLDNDCDGSIDEDFPNLTQPCTIGKGICVSSGKFVCSADKKTEECDALKIPPQTEICDGKDNDCNGQIDDGDPGGGQPCLVNGQQADCRNGKTACVQGKVECKQTYFGQPEVCNGKDDNCDGQIDEGLPTVDFYPDTDNDGYGDKFGAVVKRCAAQAPPGYVNNKGDCNDRDPNIKPGVPDICDGIDNDCDGKVDEDGTWKDWYRDADGDSYGDKTLAFRGCIKNQVTACTGENTCVSTTGYVTNNQDCCDTDPLAKPGQTGYFYVKNKCNSFDYNCDGKETPNVPICTCSRSAKYSYSGSAQYFYNTTAYTWYSVGTTTNTYTNATACEMVLTVSMGPSNNPSVQSGSCCYDCSGIGNCGTCVFGNKRYCTATFTYYASVATRSWTPVTSDSKRLVMWNKADYRAGCVYHPTGATPKCGEEGFQANALEGSTYLSKSWNETPYNGSTNCHGECSFNYRATLNYSMALDATNYSYSKPSSVPAKVECN